MQLSPDSSFMSASSFLSTDTISIDNTSNMEPIEDGVVVEPMQINQLACNIETPVQLEVELTDKARNATRTCIVLADKVV